jgi:hypothetical protein
MVEDKFEVRAETILDLRSRKKEEQIYKQKKIPRQNKQEGAACAVYIGRLYRDGAEWPGKVAFTPRLLALSLSKG